MEIIQLKVDEIFNNHILLKEKTIFEISKICIDINDFESICNINYSNSFKIFMENRNDKNFQNAKFHLNKLSNIQKLKKKWNNLFDDIFEYN